jgi:flagellar motor protein MotB
MFKGFGVTKPIHKIPEKNEVEADENRRVEILILEN